MTKQRELLEMDQKRLSFQIEFAKASAEAKRMELDLKKEELALKGKELELMGKQNELLKNADPPAAGPYLSMGVSSSVPANSFWSVKF